jgi:ATP-dependent RNA helicase DeaD
MHKLDALTRILEAEPFDAMMVFARTKQATDELAEKLEARGFAAAAINGDIAQRCASAPSSAQGRQIDILVATDVAARGLDVERISHVLNYDIPYDTESYVHRIGRTGRAGRRARRSCSSRRASAACCARSSAPPGSRSSQMNLPSVDAVNDAGWPSSSSSASSGALAWRTTCPSSATWSNATSARRTCPRSRSPPRWRAGAGRHAAAARQARRAQRAFEVREPRERSERPERAARARSDRVPRVERHAREDRAPHGAPEITGQSKTYRIEVGYQHGCSRATSSARSPTKPTSNRATSAASTSVTTSPWSTCPTACPPTRPLRMRPAESADIDAPKAKRSFGPPRGDRPGGGPRKPGGFKPRGPRF